MDMDVKVIQCQYGHFYDSIEYKTCPICLDEKKDITESSKPKEIGKNKKFSFFKKKNVSESEKNGSPEFSDFSSFTSKDDFSEKDKDIDTDTGNYGVISKKNDDDKDVTKDFWSQSNGEFVGVNGNDSREEKINDFIDESQSKVQAENSGDEDNEGDGFIKLQKQLKEASASDDGKTLSYFSFESSRQSQEPQDIYSDSAPDPVVGWLVCISGKHLGESFCIYSGRNSIGRSSSNRIVLKKDTAVSREKHMFVIYDPKNKKFYASSGVESGLAYLNDELLDTNKELSANDIIQAGESQMMFIPLCSSSFDWELYMK